MKTPTFSPARIARNLVFACVAVLLMEAAHAVELLKLDLAANRRTAEVLVPEGVSKISIECGDVRGNWQTYVSVHAVPGKMTFSLPAVDAKIPWRAVIAKKSLPNAKLKFPASFYKGLNKFGPTLSDTGGGLSFANVGLLNLGMVADMTVPTVVAPAPAPEPVEADIWKIDGSRVYYFNQLRGLQVLDLAKPSDPRLIASLRLPAVGQDLYLLPGSGEIREIVLLTTEEATKSSGPFTRVRIVQMTGDELKVTFTQDVSGRLADSRMVGNRLILATNRQGVTPFLPAATSSLAIAPQTSLTEWVLETGKAPSLAREFPIYGESPIIAAGSDRLAVATTPAQYFRPFLVTRGSGSNVTVFAIKSTGLVRLGPSVSTAGVIADQFKIQWKNNVLTTISEVNNSDNLWSPKTVLENFRVWGPDIAVPAIFTGKSNLLASLELANGESLHATRFAGNKVYVVTFRQVDPLWVVDLADAANPKIAGHIEVPGWSTHLEPLGDLLFSIGWESGGVSASLFDVSDPAAPTLLRRVSLGGWSEATWDEKALKVLPDAGLVLVPLVTTDPDSFQQVSGVQILDLDIKGRDLKKRGVISHAFEPRRADLLGETVISISQRVLVAASIEDADLPKVVSEVSLAWPTDRVCDAGDFVLQIEDGASFGDSHPTVRVSPANALEQIVSEKDLGEGSVRAADFKDGKLYVIRQLTQSTPIVASGALGIIGGGTSTNQLVLDVYDGSALPELTLLGTCKSDLGAGFGFSISPILWPQATRPSVVVNSAWPIFWDRIITPPILLQAKEVPAVSIVDEPIVIDSPRIFPPIYRPTNQKPRLVVFNVVDPAAPVAAAPLSFGGIGAALGDVKAAGGGLVVVGTSRDSVWVGPFISTAGLFKSRNAMNVFEIGLSGPATARPEIDLPGTLFAVTDLNEKGFLGFTRTVNPKKTATLQVSASNGFDAFLVASREVRAECSVAASGRRLFVGTATGVARFTLADDKTWIRESDLALGWRPAAMRSEGGKIFGLTGKSFFAADVDGKKASRWKFPTWSLSLPGVSVTESGEILAPFGEYGALRLGAAAK